MSMKEKRETVETSATEWLRRGDERADRFATLTLLTFDTESAAEAGEDLAIVLRELQAFLAERNKRTDVTFDVTISEPDYCVGCEKPYPEGECSIITDGFESGPICRSCWERML